MRRHGEGQRRAGFAVRSLEGNRGQLVLPSPGHGGEHAAGLRAVAEENALRPRIVGDVAQEIEMLRAVHAMDVAHLLRRAHPHVGNQPGAQRVEERAVRVRRHRGAFAGEGALHGRAHRRALFVAVPQPAGLAGKLLRGQQDSAGAREGLQRPRRLHRQPRAAHQQDGAIAVFADVQAAAANLAQLRQRLVVDVVEPVARLLNAVHARAAQMLLQPHGQMQLAEHVVAVHVGLGQIDRHLGPGRSPAQHGRDAMDVLGQMAIEGPPGRGVVDVGGGVKGPAAPPRLFGGIGVAVVDDHVHAVAEHRVHRGLHLLQRLGKARALEPRERLVGDDVPAVDVPRRGRQPAMDGVHLQRAMVAEGLALGNVRRGVDAQDVAPGAVGLNAADSAVGVGEVRQHVEEVLDGQLAHGLEVVIAHAGRDLAHVAPQGVDVLRQVVAPAAAEFVQQHAAPVVALHLDGIAEPAVHAGHAVGDGLHHVFEKAVHGPAAAVVDDAAVSIAAGLAHLIIVHGDDEEHQLPVALGDVDVFELRAPGPAEEHALLKAVGDVDHRLGQHPRMLHPAHHRRADGSGEAGGEVAGKIAGPGDVVLIGQRLLLGVLRVHKRAAVGPAGAGSHVHAHAALFAGPLRVGQNVVKLRRAEGNVVKARPRVVGLHGIQNLQLHAADARALHEVQLPVDLVLLHAAAVPPPARPVARLLGRMVQKFAILPFPHVPGSLPIVLLGIILAHIC